MPCSRVYFFLEGAPLCILRLLFTYEDKDKVFETSLMCKPERTKCVKNKIYVNISEEQTEVGECLVSFGAEALVFPFVIQKLKD